MCNIQCTLKKPVDFLISAGKQNKKMQSKLRTDKPLKCFSHFTQTHMEKKIKISTQMLNCPWLPLGNC